jgi:hypothetical protein
MEVEVRRDVLLTTAVAVLLTLFGATGYVVSPRGDEGRPVLLWPDVRAVEQYRRTVTDWAAQWRELNSDLRNIVKAEEGRELLSTSRDSQHAFEQAAAMEHEAEATEAPASLIGLHDQATAAALAYVNASVAVARWVSAPSADNRAAVELAITDAEDKLASLEANEWLRARDGM